MVAAFPIRQPERRRLVAHLVNYDVDLEHDQIRETSASLALPRPVYLRGRLRARLIPPVGEPEELRLNAGSSILEVEVPKLGAYGAVVIEGTDAS